MVSVTTAPSWAPHGRPFTRADLEAMPDDGRRYELIDGVLIVSPAPGRRQRAVKRLLRALDDACPADCEVLSAPVDVAVAEDTVLQPDILVGRRSDFTERDLPAAPVLAVEVLSPSTRRVDLMLKRSRYEEAGTPHYWVVDPDVPSVTAWTLDDGCYGEVGRATGDEPIALKTPFVVTVVPASLVAD